MSENETPQAPKDQPKEGRELDTRLVRMGAIEHQKKDIDKQMRVLEGRRRTMEAQKNDLVNTVIKEDGLLAESFWKASEGSESFILHAQEPLEGLFKLVEHNTKKRHHRYVGFGGGEEDKKQASLVIEKTDVAMHFDSVNDLIDFCIEFGIRSDIRPLHTYRDQLANELIELDTNMTQYIETHGVEIETAPEVKEALEVALANATQAREAKDAEEAQAKAEKDAQMESTLEQARAARAARAAEVVAKLNSEEGNPNG